MIIRNTTVTVREIGIAVQKAFRQTFRPGDASLYMTGQL